MNKGSIVQLKAGGPRMVVTGVSEHLNGDGSKRVWCQWFTYDGYLKTDEFKDFALVLDDTEELRSVQKRMEDQGISPWSEDGSKWIVTYLSRSAEGVCDAEFDTYEKAYEFAKEIMK